MIKKKQKAFELIYFIANDGSVSEQSSDIQNNQAPCQVVPLTLFTENLEQCNYDTK